MKLHDKETLNVAQAVIDVLEGKKPAAEGTHDYPHTMYHPESGEEKTAKNEEEHKALSAKGYTNEKNESPDEPVAKGEKDFKDKHVVKKSGAKSDGNIVKEGEESVADPLPEITPPGTAADTELQEGISSSDMKKALEIINDPKTKGGNYTQAVKDLEKWKKGSSKDAKVAAALKSAHESIDEAQEFWTVTVLKSMNKLKKGQKVVVKGRNAAEALKKGAKRLGDPLINQSGYLGAVKDYNPFSMMRRIATEESEKKDVKESSPHKDLSDFARSLPKIAQDKKSLSKKDRETLMNLYALLNKRKNKPGKSKADKEAAWRVKHGFEESNQAIVWKVKPPKGTKNIHPNSKWKGMKPGDIKKMNESDVTTEESEKQAKYKAFFTKALKKFGVTSPADLKGDKKKEFFDYVDKNYEADNEEDSEEEVMEATLRAL